MLTCWGSVTTADQGWAFQLGNALTMIVEFGLDTIEPPIDTVKSFVDSVKSFVNTVKSPVDGVT